jgi:hypothetical protein
MDLYEWAVHVIQLEDDLDCGIAMLMHCADRGDVRACITLARFWMGKSKLHLPPFISYRRAAEYAFAVRYTEEGKELLMECFQKCQSEELDDIKYRRTALCKNYDVERNICLVSGDLSECNGCGDICGYSVCYIPVPHFSLWSWRSS